MCPLPIAGIGGQSRAFLLPELFDQRGGKIGHIAGNKYHPFSGGVFQPGQYTGQRTGKVGGQIADRRQAAFLITGLIAVGADGNRAYLRL